MKHVVSTSGGLGSWLTLKRVIAEHGTEDVVSVFTDTKYEDEDLYRFLDDTHKKLGIDYITITEGRTPYQVFEDHKFLGNSRVAHCSEDLKVKPFYKWIDEQGWDDFIIYLGFDWSESHRLEGVRKRNPKYRFESPLCEPPYLDREQVMKELELDGIELPRLYKMGFTHNNCGGRCVKAGQAHWARLLEFMPERYAEVENEQRELMKKIPRTRPSLRMTKDGVTEYVTLEDFRKRVKGGTQVDMFDIGGCGCFAEDQPTEENMYE